MKKMKLKLFIPLLTIALIAFNSCDKIDNPYLPQYVDIDTTLLDGVDIVGYKSSYWPTFKQNTNTDRNILIEDYTGHKCVNCPEAAVELKQIIESNPERIYGVGIHIGPNGTKPFQTASGNLFATDYTTPEGIEMSKEITDGGFIGNPSGTVSRSKVNNQIFHTYSSWASIANNVLNENDLTVNIQSKVNYFPNTRGVFLHTEVELLTDFTDELYQTVYVVEDSTISAQSTPSSWNFPNDVDVNYVHRDVHRGNIDSKAMGRKLDESVQIDKDGNAIEGSKYYLNYSYKLPDEYNAENMHFLIYVYNKSTFEIYQVIKEEIIK